LLVEETANVFAQAEEMVIVEHDGVGETHQANGVSHDAEKGADELELLDLEKEAVVVASSRDQAASHLLSFS